MNTQVAANQEFYPFMFNQIRFRETIWINDEPYFTRRAIGEFLEYDMSKRDPIGHIIKRNPHINQFSVTVRLTATDEYKKKDSPDRLSGECPDNLSGTEHSLDNLTSQSSTIRHREIEIRVYNPIGLQLIIFESHQPKAKAYKVAVAHLVYAFMRGELKPPKNENDTSYQSLYFQCKEILKLAPYSERPAAIKQLSIKHRKPAGTIRHWMKRIERGENPAETRLHRRSLGCLYINKDTETEIRALVEDNPGITIKEIIRLAPRADCSAYHAVYRLKKRILKEQRSKQLTLNSVTTPLIPLF